MSITWKEMAEKQDWMGMPTKHKEAMKMDSPPSSSSQPSAWWHWQLWRLQPFSWSGATGKLDSKGSTLSPLSSHRKGPSNHQQTSPTHGRSTRERVYGPLLYWCLLINVWATLALSVCALMTCRILD
ncbi:hypothetical protein MATL_G00126130 [Megalops atlanticus]|uniref:Uncharacterized protein n=1 Tax=Megalops atlanticus TaxID=7932 RepID=A0A9D3PZU4_MEGAT|nr:hypothetical protein MATL_G00126130 [Megalops atlanticus]